MVLELDLECTSGGFYLEVNQHTAPLLQKNQHAYIEKEASLTCENLRFLSQLCHSLREQNVAKVLLVVFFIAFSRGIG